MTQSVVVFTSQSDSATAGRELGEAINKEFESRPPDALIVFASSRYEYSELLRAVDETCHPRVTVGCSSAGEFVSHQHGEGAASAVALRSSTLRFSSGLGLKLHENRVAAAEQIASSFHPNDRKFKFHSALVLTDALAGYTDDFIEQLSLATAGNYTFFGGGAGDDARFSRTHVFCGTQVETDAAVALEILSNEPVAVGVSHGWQTASDPMRVTESDGTRLVSLNAFPAADVFEEHAERTGQTFDRADPIPFFLHNVLGIDTGNGYKLRVPLGVQEDGSISCASDIPAGATVHIMKTTVRSASDAAVSATESALQRVEGGKPQVALFFDCVATRLRTGREFGMEMTALQEALGDVSYAGCNTYGQIARAEGQFSGFHNCTATVALIPG